MEGEAERVTSKERLTALANAYRDKYGGAGFDCGDEVFDPNGERAIIFEVTPAKVIAFAKGPARPDDLQTVICVRFARSSQQNAHKSL